MTEPRYVTEIPPGVTFYPDSHTFIAEDPSRQNKAWGIEGDIKGWDVADGFRLSESTIPSEPDSEWRISVHERTVYAVLRQFPNFDTYTFDGPVWHIAEVPEYIDSSVDGRAIRRLMWEVELLKRDKDSLLTAVLRIHSGFSLLDEACKELLRTEPAQLARQLEQELWQDAGETN